MDPCWQLGPLPMSAVSLRALGAWLGHGWGQKPLVATGWLKELIPPWSLLRRIDQPCPRGWWGHPTCGPCNCDVSKGFDPDCNKTSGECHCKVTAPSQACTATASAAVLYFLGPWGVGGGRSLPTER